MAEQAGSVCSVADLALYAFTKAEVAPTDPAAALTAANSLITWMIESGYTSTPGDSDSSVLTRVQNFGTGLRNFYNLKTGAFGDDQHSTLDAMARIVRSGDFYGPSNTWITIVLGRLALKYGTSLGNTLLRAYLNAAFDAWYVERRDGWCPGLSCFHFDKSVCHNDGSGDPQLPGYKPPAYIGFTNRAKTFQENRRLSTADLAKKYQLTDRDVLARDALYATPDSLVARDQFMHYAAMCVLDACRVAFPDDMPQHPIDNATQYAALRASLRSLMGTSLWHEEDGTPDPCVTAETAAESAQKLANLAAQYESGDQPFPPAKRLGYYYHRTKACSVTDTIFCNGAAVVEDQILGYLSGCDPSEEQREKALQWGVMMNEEADANAPPFGCGSRLGGLRCTRENFTDEWLFLGLRHDTDSDGICVLTTAQACVAWQLYVANLPTTDHMYQVYRRKRDVLLATLTRLSRLVSAGTGVGIPASFRSLKAYQGMREAHNTSLGFSYFQMSHTQTALWTALALELARLLGPGGATVTDVTHLNPLLTNFTDTTLQKQTLTAAQLPTALPKWAT